MNTNEIQEIQMYNAQLKIHEDLNYKLRIEHLLPLTVIFGCGLHTGAVIVLILSVFFK